MPRSPQSIPPRPADEASRLHTLQSYHILDTPAEPVFDEIASLAARLLDTPMALVTLVDEDRQWFKANVGLRDSQSDRDDSFCAHALGKPDLMVIPDAALDDRFRDNPFVVADPHIRFYAGAPLVAPDGQGLGALCVLDRVPRTLTEDQATTLRVLGRQVMAQLELHRLLRHAREDVSHMHEVTRLKNEFVATVSHELRTPLTSLQGSLQLLLSDDEALPTQEGRDLVGVAVKNSERLVRIVNDILDIAKIEAGQLPMVLTRLDVAPLLEAAMDTVRGLARDKQLRLVVEAADPLPAVLVDQDRIVQSIVNLLSNAIKFSPAGGLVTLTATGAEDVRMAVSDQGRDIPADQLRLVFDKFHQVGGPNRQGTGLGLSITKAIVEQHGGRIDVTSVVDAGTTFTITLPAAPPNDHA